MVGKLYGVGVGPGDPELLTLKAIRILQSVEVVVAPDGGGEHLAYRVVQPYLRNTVIFLPFRMGQGTESLAQDDVERIRKLLEMGKEVAFVTLGDPLLYSTFVTLWRCLPEVEVEIVPGVSAFQLAAGKLRMPLAQGKERLAILPGEGLTERILEGFDHLVIFKVSRECRALLERLRRWHFQVGLASRLGLAEEVVYRDLEHLGEIPLDYFSLLIARKV
ncbi:MAG: precorrin-2 C(20)-methyltransferase [Candidatus Caldatribacteriaceae bacterium]